MIVVVAPYSPASVGGFAHLGAARKLETVIKSLSRIDEKIVIVNSAHNSIEPTPITFRHVMVAGSPVTEYIPPCYRWRPIGKLLNLFDVRKALKFTQELGEIKFVWIYNLYAFEVIFAIFAKYCLGSKIILEYEDGIFARRRPFGVKPLMDFIFSRFLIRRLDYAFCVNPRLSIELSSYGVSNYTLPGLASDEALINPVKCDGLDNNLVVGYFGGLNEEKGGLLLLDLCECLRGKGVTFVITGSGPLSDKFSEAANDNNCINYHGSVAVEELIKIIAGVDVILNPHMPLGADSDIFPSKIVEAVSFGCPVVSTKLPDPGCDGILSAVIQCEPNVEAFSNAIHAIGSRIDHYREIAKKSRAIVSERLSTHALLNIVRCNILKN